ncbi:MAG: protein-L-isoaspartate(D-aspartate) O-methyltransferase [Bacteroidales bacterium]|nr:protein-L-isoaspartate(D-aspartate) O-methyltransferase [Bacteroidales bacterium]
MEDNYRHKGLRKKLVNEIRKKGILDEQILNAFMAIPRHLFLDSGFLEFAYEDKPFPIGSGQTISQPYTVAFQTQLLDIRPGSKILEIGTGSGYQACILAELGADVYTIERQKKLFEKTKKFLSRFPYDLHLFQGDGFKGVPQHAPYDGIIITAAAPEIPQDLVDQLQIGGVLVIPLGEGSVQTMLRIVKQEDGSLQRQQFGGFRFVPMLRDSGND